MAGAETGSERPQKQNGRRLTEAEWWAQLKSWVDGIRKTNAWLRYLLRLEPDAMTLEEWALRVEELRYVREAEKG